MSAAGRRRPPAAPDWPAMLLTAGLGTRLRPLTRLAAKPSLPVAGIPLAGRILGWLASAGVRDAVLNLHDRPESITAAIGDGSGFGVRVRYSWEPQLLGSAGGPARALPLLDAERFFLVNGDTLSNGDLAALASAHVASQALVTLALTANPDPTHYGGVAVDADGAVTGFTPKGPGNAGLHFIGIQAVEARVFAGLDPDTPADTIGGIYDALVAGRRGLVRAFVCQASFRDIGTAADYLATCLDLARDDGQGNVIAEPGSFVDADASIARSVIWSGARVSAGTVLDECVVATGAHLPPGSRFSRCVIRPDTGPDHRDPFETPTGRLLVSPIDIRRASRNRTDA